MERADKVSLDRVRKELLDCWDGVPAANLCIKILDFIEATPPEELSFLTFGRLCQIMGRKSVDVEIVAAINILVGSRMGLLDAQAMLVDEDETEHELSAEELAKARQAGGLVHPETGEEVTDFEEQLIPFFTPSERLLSELE